MGKYKHSLILKTQEILKIPIPALILVIIAHSCAPLQPLAPQQNSRPTAERETTAQTASHKTQSKTAKKDTQTHSGQKITGISAWDNVLSPWLGTPYLYGGSTKAGTDCSGFVGSVYREKEGMYLPRTASEGFKSGRSVGINNLTVGDLVFFGEKGNISHVGIFVGKGNFIHASTSLGVTVTPLDDSYWKPRYKGARRYL